MRPFIDQAANVHAIGAAPSVPVLVDSDTPWMFAAIVAWSVIQGADAASDPLDR